MLIARQGSSGGNVPETFGQLLRQLRVEAGLTQEELAEAAKLSPRSISDLERGINLTARKDTARLLARALGLPAQPERVRGRRPWPGSSRCSVRPGGFAAATRTLPRDVAGFTGREAELRELIGGSAEAADPVAGDHSRARRDGWQSARRRWRSTPRTGSRRSSPTARSSSRCTVIRRASGRWIRRTRSPACC